MNPEETGPGRIGDASSNQRPPGDNVSVSLRPSIQSAVVRPQISQLVYLNNQPSEAPQMHRSMSLGNLSHNGTLAPTIAANNAFQDASVARERYFMQHATPPLPSISQRSMSGASLMAPSPTNGANALEVNQHSQHAYTSAPFNPVGVGPPLLGGTNDVTIMISNANAFTFNPVLHGVADGPMLLSKSIDEQFIGARAAPSGSMAIYPMRNYPQHLQQGSFSADGKVSGMSIVSRIARPGEALPPTVLNRSQSGSMVPPRAISTSAGIIGKMSLGRTGGSDVGRANELWNSRLQQGTLKPNGAAPAIVHSVSTAHTAPQAAFRADVSNYLQHQHLRMADSHGSAPSELSDNATSPWMQAGYYGIDHSTANYAMTAHSAPQQSYFPAPYQRWGEHSDDLQLSMRIDANSLTADPTTANALPPAFTLSKDKKPKKSKKEPKHKREVMAPAFVPTHANDADRSAFDNSSRYEPGGADLGFASMPVPQNFYTPPVAMGGMMVVSASATKPKKEKKPKKDDGVQPPQPLPSAEKDDPTDAVGFVDVKPAKLKPSSKKKAKVQVGQLADATIDGISTYVAATSELLPVQIASGGAVVDLAAPDGAEGKPKKKPRKPRPSRAKAARGDVASSADQDAAEDKPCAESTSGATYAEAGNDPTLVDEQAAGVADASALGKSDRDESFTALLRRREPVVFRLMEIESERFTGRKFPAFTVCGTNRGLSTDSIADYNGMDVFPVRPRQKSLRDFLLEEMQWMAVDFRQELRHHIASSSVVASMCKDQHALRAHARQSVPADSSQSAAYLANRAVARQRASVLSQTVSRVWAVLEEVEKPKVPPIVFSEQAPEPFVSDESSDSLLAEEIDRVLKFRPSLQSAADAFLLDDHINSSALTTAQRELVSLGLDYNNSLLAPIVWGDAAGGKTFGSCGIVLEWLRRAGKAAPVLLFCSSRRVCKWLRVMESAPFRLSSECWLPHEPLKMERTAGVVIVSEEFADQFLEWRSAHLSSSQEQCGAYSGVVLDMRGADHAKDWNGSWVQRLGDSFSGTVPNRSVVVDLGFSVAQNLQASLQVLNFAIQRTKCRDWLALFCGNRNQKSTDGRDFSSDGVSAFKIRERSKQVTTVVQQLLSRLAVLVSQRVPTAFSKSCSVPVSVKEEIVAVQMQTPQRSKYLLVGKMFSAAPEATMGGDIALLSRLVCLLRRVCFHAALVEVSLGNGSNDTRCGVSTVDDSNIDALQGQEVVPRKLDDRIISTFHDRCVNGNVMVDDSDVSGACKLGALKEILRTHPGRKLLVVVATLVELQLVRSVLKGLVAPCFVCDLVDLPQAACKTDGTPDAPTAWMEVERFNRSAAGVLVCSHHLFQALEARQAVSWTNVSPSFWTKLADTDLPMPHTAEVVVIMSEMWSVDGSVAIRQCFERLSSSSGRVVRVVRLVCEDTLEDVMVRGSSVVDQNSRVDRATSNAALLASLQGVPLGQIRVAADSTLDGSDPGGRGGVSRTTRRMLSLAPSSLRWQVSKPQGVDLQSMLRANDGPTSKHSSRSASPIPAPVTQSCEVVSTEAPKRTSTGGKGSIVLNQNGQATFVRATSLQPLDPVAVCRSTSESSLFGEDGLYSLYSRSDMRDKSAAFLVMSRKADIPQSTVDLDAVAWLDRFASEVEAQERASDASGLSEFRKSTPAQTSESAISRLSAAQNLRRVVARNDFSNTLAMQVRDLLTSTKACLIAAARDSADLSVSSIRAAEGVDFMHQLGRAPPANKLCKPLHANAFGAATPFETSFQSLANRVISVNAAAKNDSVVDDQSDLYPCWDFFKCMSAAQRSGWNVDHVLYVNPLSTADMHSLQAIETFERFSGLCSSSTLTIKLVNNTRNYLAGNKLGSGSNKRFKVTQSVNASAPKKRPVNKVVEEARITEDAVVPDVKRAKLQDKPVNCPADPSNAPTGDEPQVATASVDSRLAGQTAFTAQISSTGSDNQTSGFNGAAHDAAGAAQMQSAGPDDHGMGNFALGSAKLYSSTAETSTVEPANFPSESLHRLYNAQGEWLSVEDDVIICMQNSFADPDFSHTANWLNKSKNLSRVKRTPFEAKNRYHQLCQSGKTQERMQDANILSTIMRLKVSIRKRVVTYNEASDQPGGQAVAQSVHASDNTERNVRKSVFNAAAQLSCASADDHARRTDTSRSNSASNTSI